MAEQRLQIRNAAMLHSGDRENDDQREEREGGPLHKPGAGCDPAVVQPRQNHRDRQTKQNVRQVNRMAFKTV